MKKLLVLAGALLALSFIFPQGIPLPAVPQPTPVAPAPVVPTDSALVAVLGKATAADRARVNSVYTGLATVLERDYAKGKWLTTTEQWTELHARTLNLAIDTPGKYPGLDTAIEAVFLSTVGTDDVLPNNADTHQKLIKACQIVAASAK